MNVKPKFVYYDIRRKQSVCLTMYTHENDVDTQVLEVSMLDNGEPIELDADYTYSAAIVNRDTKALINDNISCELNDSGNVLIPIDNFHTLGAQDLLIELTITDSAGDQVLVTPFPLWIHVNASILDDAQVTPESIGTVPDLLEEAKEALETVGDYENLENKPQINGHELVGNKSSDDLGLQGKLTAGENITINANGEISASGGVTSYAELNNKPKVLNSNGILISQILDSLQFGSDFSVGNVEDPNKININLTRYISGSKIAERTLPLTSIVADDFARLFKYIPEYGVTRKNINDYGKYDSYDGYSQGQGCFITKITDFSYYRNMPVNSPCFLINATPFGDTYGFQAIVAYDVVNNSTVIKTRFSYNLSSSSWTLWREIGEKGDKGDPGDAYVLTAQDKSDIAAIVLSELPTTQGVQYGN